MRIIELHAFQLTALCVLEFQESAAPEAEAELLSSYRKHRRFETSLYDTIGTHMIQGLDHIAVVVRNTEDALKFYRDVLGLRVLNSEILQNPYVRTTYLDLGVAQLQILEPLYESGPLIDYRKAFEYLRPKPCTLKRLDAD